MTNVILPFHFSKIVREFQYIYQPIREKKLKSCERILRINSTNRKKGTNQLKLLQVLKTEMKSKSYMSTLLKNLKNE